MYALCARSRRKDFLDDDDESDATRARMSARGSVLRARVYVCFVV